MSTVTPTLLVACFSNDRLGLTANVRELPDAVFEVAVVDAFSGGVVISRIFTTKDVAIEVAKVLTEQSD